MSDVDAYRPGLRAYCSTALPEKTPADKPMETPAGRAVSTAGRRIVTRWHDTSPTDEIEALPVTQHIPWRDRLPGNGDGSGSVRTHHNRYIPQIVADVSDAPGKQSEQEYPSRKFGWNRLAAAIRIWMRR